MVVKPSNEGSSIGVKICKNYNQLKLSVEKLIKIYKSLIVENYIAGQEIQVAVINGKAFDWDSFRREVRRQRALDEKVQAVISASAKLSYGRVMRLIDAIRIDGVERYALNIESDSELNPKAD